METTDPDAPCDIVATYVRPRYEDPHLEEDGIARKRQASPAEEQFELFYYDQLFGTFYDYAELVIQCVVAAGGGVLCVSGSRSVWCCVLGFGFGSAARLVEAKNQNPRAVTGGELRNELIRACVSSRAPLGMATRRSSSRRSRSRRSWRS